MPDALEGGTSQENNRLGEKIIAKSVAAVPVVGRFTDLEVDESARDVHREWRPDVRVSRGALGAVLPAVVAVLAGVRDGVKTPHTFPRADVERLYVAGRIVGVHKAVANSIADDDEALVNDRR